MRGALSINSPCAEAQSLRAKSSGKNNYNRSPSKRSRTPPIPTSPLLSLPPPPLPTPFLSPWAGSSKPLSHPYPGTTSHIRGSTILYKILAVVMLGALYYYFFITTRQRFEPRVRSPTCRSANNNTNDILLSVLTRGDIYIAPAPFSNHHVCCIRFKIELREYNRGYPRDTFSLSLSRVIRYV